MKREDVLYQKVHTGFEISHIRRSGSFDMRLKHYHDGYEIYYLMAGERCYFIKDRIYHVVKGDIVVINENELHKTTADAAGTKHERILINFGREYLQGLMLDSPDIDIFSVFCNPNSVIKLDVHEQNNVESILFRIINESKNGGAGSKLSIKIALVNLLILLFRKVEQQRGESFKHISPLHEKISEIVKYININFVKQITLGSISKEFFISSCYLSRVFKEVTGFTFIEYLNSVRTKEAQRLLKNTGLSVTRIAEMTGYDSITHFGRVFKSMTGFSPLRYRKVNRNY